MSPQLAQQRTSWWIQVSGSLSAAAILMAGCVDAPPVPDTATVENSSTPESPSPSTDLDLTLPETELGLAETPAEPTPAHSVDEDWVSQDVSSQAVTAAATEPTPLEATRPMPLAAKPESTAPMSTVPQSAEPTPLAELTPAVTPTPVAEAAPAPLVTASTEPMPTPVRLTPPELGPVPEAEPTPLEPTPVEPTPLEPTLVEPAPLAEMTPPPAVRPDLPTTTALQPPAQPALTIGEREPKPASPRQIIVLSPKRIDPPAATVPAEPTTPDVAPQTTPTAKAPTLMPPELALRTTPADAVPSPSTPEMTASPPAATEPTPPEVSANTTPEGVPTKSVALTRTTDNIPEGFQTLFNGQDLTGWDVYDGKSASWAVVDGEIRCTAAGGGWLQTIDSYSDFELRFEYRLSPGGNSGVSLRFPRQGNPSLQGLEIQLLDDQASKFQGISPKQATGSLYFTAAPTRTDVAKPAGEWNQCTVVCRGPAITVEINGERVNTIDLGQIGDKSADGVHTIAALRSPTGAIALQSHSTRVDYRQIAIKDLTQPLPSGARWLDIVEGAGDVALPGAKVTVHYIGHVASGKRFGNSYDKGKPSTVSLLEVIPGWREGIPGMKVGGKRRLVVPAPLAYGSKGYRDVIPANATLVYEIELLDVDGGVLPEGAEPRIPQPTLQPISFPAKSASALPEAAEPSSTVPAPETPKVEEPSDAGTIVAPPALLVPPIP